MPILVETRPLNITSWQLGYQRKNQVSHQIFQLYLAIHMLVITILPEVWVILLIAQLFCCQALQVILKSWALLRPECLFVTQTERFLCEFLMALRWPCARLRWWNIMMSDLFVCLFLSCEGQEVKQKGTDITDAVCDKPLCSTPRKYLVLLWLNICAVLHSNTQRVLLWLNICAVLHLNTYIWVSYCMI